MEGPFASKEVPALQQMLCAQNHRGPDGSGIYQDTRVLLGHRRLSILDLSEAGRQPMANEDETLWVSCNGEIYNFQELREELARVGHVFRSKTDTEILLHGYETWGLEELLRRLRGMFAFALYDSPSSGRPWRLILAKDRFGMKPLYYYQDPRQFLFASEVRALLKSGLVPKEKNLEAWVQFLRFGSVPTPHTTVKGVRSLPAAHYMEIGPQGARTVRYWDPLAFQVSGPDARVDAPPYRRTRELLEESLRLHLISDVPTGIFLSGGVDSSALVALACRARKEPVTTVSLSFDESRYDESPYSDLVAKRFGTRHRRVSIQAKGFFADLPSFFRSMDQPSADGINTYMVCKAAKTAGLTVVLSGAGADEIFLGYNHLKLHSALNGVWQAFSKAPPAIRGMAAHALASTCVLSGFHGADRLAGLKEGSLDSAYLVFRGLFSDRQIQGLTGLGERNLARRNMIPLESTLSRLPLTEALRFFDLTLYLQNQLLKDSDSMSMAHSIEMRLPFLDHHLAEWVFSLPDRWKIQKRINKPLLVNAVGEDLPREVWARPKMGFTLPIGEWLRQNSGPMESAALSGGFLDKRAVAQVFSRFRTGDIHWSRPWALVVAARFES